MVPYLKIKAFGSNNVSISTISFFTHKFTREKQKDKLLHSKNTSSAVSSQDIVILPLNLLPCVLN